MADFYFFFHIACILFVWVFFFSMIINVVSNYVTPIGIYHELKPIFKEGKGEPFHEKILRICYYNYMLSLPVFSVILVTIRLTLPGELDPTATSAEEYIIPSLIAIVLLPIIRIIANPSNLIKPSLCKFENEHEYFELHTANKQKIARIWRHILNKPKLIYGAALLNNAKKRKEELIIRECVRIHKERFLSFLFAYIATGITLLIILYSYEVYHSSNVTLNLPQLTQDKLLLIIIFYFVALLIATLIGEVIFLITPPIVQIPYKKQ